MEEQNQQPTLQPEKPKKKFYKKWWIWTGLILLLLISFYYADFNYKNGPYCLEKISGCFVSQSIYKINCSLHGGEYYEFHIGWQGSACGMSKTNDAGQKCTSSNECEGKCVVYMDLIGPDSFQCSKYLENDINQGLYESFGW